MWKQWKNKVKNILKNDTSDTNYSEQPVYKNRQNVKSKMTYQYPKERSFRFPVIPDEDIRNYKEDNAPAYMRRDQPKINNIKPERKESQDSSRKVYKSVNSPPFQPSDVPSPVYGFQKRKHVIENVPAYKRKEKENENPEMEVPEKETLVLTDDLSENTIQEENPVVHEELTQDILQQINRPVEEAVIEPNEGEKVLSMQKEKNHMQLDRKEVLQNPVQKPITRAERRRENKKTSNHPFNVIMTPSDKQLLQQKQRTSTTATKPSLVKEVPEKAVTNQVSEHLKGMQIPFHLLNDPVPENNENDLWIQEQQNLLEQTLKHFNVAARVVKSTQGPSVTRFEVQPEMGVKVSKIRNLSDDLKLNMSAQDIRIEAPIPGKNTVGIEVPNPKAQTVGLQEIFETDSFKNSDSPLTIALGLDIEGKPKVTNVQKMPHGLIAGATGSGKSVCINSILLSILYKASHEDVKFLLIDPKMVELAPYNGIPHLVAPVITDVKAATQSLKWAVNEMEERYESFVKEGVRDIERFNRKVVNDGRLQEKMPYIVIVIDELADLMMMSPQDVENSISRIAQKARACGIHLLLATQRPSVDVITGLIKANIPTRIAFSVSSQVDSRTILDTSGADKLLGKGDMLFMENGTGKSIRLQGPFVSDEEIERVTAYAREIAEPEYLFEQEQLLEQLQIDEDEDELLEDAIQFVLMQRSASTSMLQRHFKVGYNRAARLIDTMELRGIISGQNGSKPREVLVAESAIE